ncbi:hypothetical protein J2X72_000921 [Phyllobacterium sp. 1468]|uniref:hypothetical protein n=1 Tax=Phyllobacterium sp. 1468 TaxID=2817759 RepID=UPI00285F2DD0|nr:hypothetical protein [Phyllobacterium sp. 1468]MDR6632150.1 hypothetical protein [Phyllobacterium sp. 1468]
MSFHRAMPKPEGFGPNSPGPLVEPHFARNAGNSTSGFESLLVCKATNGWVSGWRTPTLSGGVGRWKDIGLATFRVDCLAIRETELALNKQNLL